MAKKKQTTEELFDEIKRVAIKLNIGMFMMSVHHKSEPFRMIEIAEHLQHLTEKYDYTVDEINEIFKELLSENAKIIEEKKSR